MNQPTPSQKAGPGGKLPVLPVYFEKPHYCSQEKDVPLPSGLGPHPPLYSPNSALSRADHAGAPPLCVCLGPGKCHTPASLCARCSLWVGGPEPPLLSPCRAAFSSSFRPQPRHHPDAFPNPSLVRAPLFCALVNQRSSPSQRLVTVPTAS